MSLEVFLICSYKKLRRHEASKLKLKAVPAEEYTKTLSKLRCETDGKPNSENSQQNKQWMLVSQPCNLNPRFLMTNNRGGFAFAEKNELINTFIDFEANGDVPDVRFESFGAQRWHNIVFVTSSDRSLFFKYHDYSHKPPSADFLFQTHSLKIPKHYLGMTSPNLSRNLCVTKSGVMVLLSACDPHNISVMDLRKLKANCSKQLSSEYFDSLVSKKSATANIGEVSADPIEDIAYIMPYCSGMLFRFTSKQLRNQATTLEIGNHQENDNSPRFTALAVPTQTTLNSRIYRPKTYLAGMIQNNSEGTQLLVCLRNMQDGQTLSQVDLLSHSHGCGPLHSIKEVSGSRGTLFLANSDEQFSHLIGSYNLKLQVLQPAMPTANGQMFNVLTERVSAAEFRILATDASQPTSQPLMLTLKLP